ncbi:Subtilisin-like protease 3 [Gracilariopsis chorda]|uniref:Subtilisin-like protease 3 n=1 Tax=Gracilariopsis chorda TaxID=448386 RepID=A0A2V3IZ41_9FLOR|nr:Subtilisin-like protease 3 [Gracilariopsis chorda]|eukprot:PXF47323.1 Subtilisin-like protease 3 [Gracilariopsis chorda]
MEFRNKRAIYGMNIRNPETDADDCNGHGTHVAALAIGRESGVAKHARAISVKVLDCNGKGSCSDILSGMEWVAANSSWRRERGERSVLVMSVGSTSDACAQTLDAAQVLWESGVFIAAAAGNLRLDSCRMYPARSMHTMTVGAVDKKDRMYHKNNVGACIDIFAPGVDILSATGLDSDTGITEKSGTSMATPLVAGTAALIVGSHFSLSSDEVRDVLLSSSTKSKIMNANGDKIMTITRNRLLYAPWNRLFDDIEMDGNTTGQNNFDHREITMADNRNWNSSSVLVSVSLTLIPGISPAMTYSATRIKRWLSTQTGIEETSILVRRAKGVHRLPDHKEPKHIPLMYYFPTNPKFTSLFVARARLSVDSRGLQSSILENVTFNGSSEDVVSQYVVLPDAVIDSTLVGGSSNGGLENGIDVIMISIIGVCVVTVMALSALFVHCVRRRRRVEGGSIDLNGKQNTSTDVV